MPCALPTAATPSPNLLAQIQRDSSHLMHAVGLAFGVSSPPRPLDGGAGAPVCQGSWRGIGVRSHR